MAIIYNLGWLDRNNKGVTLQEDIEISSDEFQKLNDSNEIIGYFINNYDYFEMMIQNFDEVLYVINLFEKRSKDFKYNREIKPYVKELNRVFINALGSFACFLNHYEFILKNHYEETIYFEKFKYLLAHEAKAVYRT